MKIKLTDRISECNDKMREYTSELKDYEQIIMLIRSLQLVSLNPTKWKYEQAEYDSVLSKLHSLCEKHEIRLPDFVEWSTIEIV